MERLFVVIDVERGIGCAVAGLDQTVGGDRLVVEIIGLGGVLALTQFLPASGVATGVSVAFGGVVALSTIVYSVLQRRKRLPSDVDE